MAKSSYRHPSPEGPVATAAEPIPVRICLSPLNRLLDPVYVGGVATAWTASVVRVEFVAGGKVFDQWVWAKDVRRLDGGSAGVEGAPPLNA